MKAFQNHQTSAHWIWCVPRGDSASNKKHTNAKQNNSHAKSTKSKLKRTECCSGASLRKSKRNDRGKKWQTANKPIGRNIRGLNISRTIPLPAFPRIMVRCAAARGERTPLQDQIWQELKKMADKQQDNQDDLVATLVFQRHS